MCNLHFCPGAYAFRILAPEMTLTSVNKEKLLDALISLTGRQVEDLTRLARETAAGATHEEARPDDDKDTRALEQTYLARGQAERVVSAESDLQVLRSVRCLPFPEDSPVAATALVEIEDENGVNRTLFLLPVAGGTKLEAGSRTVHIITPHSPLGRALLEKCEGDEVEIRTGKTPRFWEIVGVS